MLKKDSLSIRRRKNIVFLLKGKCPCEKKHKREKNTMKMRKSILCASGLLLVMLGCGNIINNPGSNNKVELSKNDKQLYSAFFSINNIKSLCSYIVIINKSKYYPSRFMHIDSTDTIATKELLAKYDSLNQDTISWSNYNFDIGIGYIMIDQKQIDSLFAGKNAQTAWNEFYIKYNECGTFAFSRIAYNSDSTVAVLSVFHEYGDLGADRYVVTMVFKNGVWSIYQGINMQS